MPKKTGVSLTLEARGANASKINNVTSQVWSIADRSSKRQRQWGLCWLDVLWPHGSPRLASFKGQMTCNLWAILLPFGKAYCIDAYICQVSRVLPRLKQPAWCTGGVCCQQMALHAVNLVLAGLVIELAIISIAWILPLCSLYTASKCWDLGCIANSLLFPLEGIFGGRFSRCPRTQVRARNEHLLHNRQLKIMNNRFIASDIYAKQQQKEQTFRTQVNGAWC